MDDNQNANLTSPVTQPVSPPPPLKEQEPLVSEQSLETLVQPSEVEPVLHPEVKEVGVVKVPQIPTLTLEDQKAGLALAKESVPVPTQPSGLVGLPKDEKEAASFLKVHRDVKNAVVWLVAMLLRQFRQAHEKVVGVKP